MIIPKTHNPKFHVQLGSDRLSLTEASLNSSHAMSLITRTG